MMTIAKFCHSLSATNDLPAKSTYYHGHGEFVQMVAEKILVGHQNGNPPRISIHGVPGLGKSASAVGVLHHHAVKAFYEDHRYFVSCETSLTPTLLLFALATALGLKASGERDGFLSQIIATLRAIKFPVLLVLDNFEVCWNSGKRREVQNVLDRLDSLRNVAFMVTMRSSSGPDGTFWTNTPRLKVLDSASAQQVFNEVAGKSEDLDPDMLDRLLRRVEYLPQAVVLLARLMRRGETLTSICQRWELEGTSIISSSIEDHHCNLNATFNLSISSYPMKVFPSALRLLSTLACLPNGIPRDNLGSVTYIPKSKVHQAAQTLNEIGLAEYDNDILKVIAPIRQYVSQHHPPPSEDVLKTRRHYRSVISQIQNCKSWREARQMLDNIEPERGNIYETLIRWINSSERMDEATSVVLQLSKFLFTASDGTALLERIVRDQIDNISPVMRAALFHMHGMSLLTAEDYSPACHSLERAHNIYATSKDSIGRSACSWCIGDIYRHQGRYQEALSHLESALAGYRELGSSCHLRSQAACLWSLADVYHVLGLSEVGYEAAKEASHLCQEINDRTGVISAALLCASIEISRNNLIQAQELLDTNFEECQPQTHPTNHRNYLLQLGKLFCSKGSLQEANGSLSQALGLYTSNSRASRQGRADALRYLGVVALRAEDPDLAEQSLQGAQEIYQSLDNSLNIAKITSCFGRLYLLQGKKQDAEAAFVKAQDLYSNLGCKRGCAECLLSIGRIRVGQGHHAEAILLFQEAGDVYYEVGNPTQAGVCQQMVENLTNRANELIPDEAAGLAEEGRQGLEEPRLMAPNSTVGRSDGFGWARARAQIPWAGFSGLGLGLRTRPIYQPGPNCQQWSQRSSSDVDAD
jgi:tetratricopeptide (TPR) repeat protein